MNIITKKLFLLSMIVLLLFPGTAFSETTSAGKVGKSLFGLDKINTGKKYGFEFHPYLKEDFVYTDNVFHDPYNSKSPDKTPQTTSKDETIWQHSPGFNATYTQEKFKVGIAYEANFRYFTKYEKQNEQDQHFGALIELKPTENSYLKVTERLEQIGLQARSILLEPIDYLENQVEVRTGVKKGQWTPTLNYSNFIRKYSSGRFENLNYHENKVGSRLYFDFENRSLTNYMGYTLGFVDYPKEIRRRESVYHDFIGGFSGILPGEINFDAYVGVHRRDFRGSVRDDLTMAIASVALSKDFTEKFTGELAYLRRPYESTFDDQPYVKHNEMRLGLTYALTPKMRLQSKTSFGRPSYDDPAQVGSFFRVRRDYVFSKKVGFDYALQDWMILHCYYTINVRRSNIQDFDFTENHLWVGTTFSL